MSPYCGLQHRIGQAMWIGMREFTCANRLEPGRASWHRPYCGSRRQRYKRHRPIDRLKTERRRQGVEYWIK